MASCQRGIFSATSLLKLGKDCKVDRQRGDLKGVQITQALQPWTARSSPVPLSLVGTVIHSLVEVSRWTRLAVAVSGDSHSMIL